MEEKRKIQPIEVNYRCHCGSYIYFDQKEDSGYSHLCPNCGEKRIFYQKKYPYIEWKPITG